MTTQERDSLTGRWGADWLAPIRNSARDVVRTEIRLRARHNANVEIRRIEAALDERISDVVHLRSLPSWLADGTGTFEEVEAFINLSRRDIFRVYGGYRKKQLEDVVESY